MNGSRRERRGRVYHEQYVVVECHLKLKQLFAFYERSKPRPSPQVDRTLCECDKSDLRRDLSDPGVLTFEVRTKADAFVATTASRHGRRDDVRASRARARTQRRGPQA